MYLRYQRHRTSPPRRERRLRKLPMPKFVKHPPDRRLTRQHKLMLLKRPPVKRRTPPRQHELVLNVADGLKNVQQQPLRPKPPLHPPLFRHVRHLAHSLLHKRGVPRKKKVQKKQPMAVRPLPLKVAVLPQPPNPLPFNVPRCVNRRQLKPPVMARLPRLQLLQKRVGAPLQRAKPKQKPVEKPKPKLRLAKHPRKQNVQLVRKKKLHLKRRTKQPYPPKLFQRLKRKVRL